jgi:hypothetical protein
MPDDALATARAELRAAPLEDWVAERGRLAKALEADGEPEAAAQLAKEPKPSAAEWAVGRIADVDRDAVADWNASAAHLREASGKRGAGDELREAMAAHREATESLVEAISERIEPNGRPLSDAMLERVRELLQETTADPEGLGGVTPSERRSPARTSKPKSTPKSKSTSKPDPAAEARARKRADLERAVAEAQDEASRLAAEADRAEATADDAEATARDAAATAREARKQATAGARELDRLRTRLDRL